MRQQPGLASCLMTGLPDLDREGGRLTLAFEPDNGFMMARLEECRADLQQYVDGFFGPGMTLVLQLVGDGAGPSQAQQEAVRREVAPTDREVLARECQQDEVLGRLVDMVQGEPLADAERDKWRRPGDDDDPSGDGS
jgi:hypothetical protein